MISLSLLLVVLYTIYLSYYINLRVTQNLCDLNKQRESKQFTIAWETYDTVLCTFELCISLWLILASYFTIQVLRSNINENFRREKYKIYVILTTYTLIYFVQFCYHVYMLVVSVSPEFFFRDEWDLVGQSIINFSIIFITFHLHWTNSISIVGLFKMGWLSKKIGYDRSDKYNSFGTIESGRDQTKVMLQGATEIE